MQGESNSAAVSQRVTAVKSLQVIIMLPEGRYILYEQETRDEIWQVSGQRQLQGR